MEVVIISNKVYLSAPIAKTVETPDGGREVWGFATLEVTDKANEIADFDGTVKAFEKWSNDVSKRTGGKSMGNVRVMHQAVTAGKMIHWEPTETTVTNDDGTEQVVKGIWTGAYVPPTKPEVIRDIDEGILSALSIGGGYAKRWWDDAAKAFRFIPELAEYSLVDNPCVPGADIVTVISKSSGPWAQSNRNLGGEIVEDDLAKSKKPAGSMEDLKSRIDAACEVQFRGMSSYWDGYIVATYMDHVVIYNYNQGKYYDVPFEDKDNTVTLGTPVEVEQRYVPIEAQKAVQAELAKRRLADNEGGDGLHVTRPPENSSTLQEGSEKALTIEQLQKAANEAGLTVQQVEAFFKAMAADATTPAPTTVGTVDGDGDDDKNKEFPNPPSGDEKINIAGAENDVKAAEQASGVSAEKGATDGDLEKAGKAISKNRMMHMTHAMNHIKAAMDGTEYGPEHHMTVENDTAGDGPNSGMEAPEVTTKAFTSMFEKSIGVSVSTELSKAVGQLEILVKELPSADQFTALKEQIDATRTMVKAIHDTPQAGGPVLNGGSPDMFQVMKGGATDMSTVTDSALEEFVKSIQDPVARDHASQELAKRRMSAVFRGGNA